MSPMLPERHMIPNRIPMKPGGPSTAACRAVAPPMGQTGVVQVMVE